MQRTRLTAEQEEDFLQLRLFANGFGISGSKFDSTIRPAFLEVFYDKNGELTVNSIGTIFHPNTYIELDDALKEHGAQLGVIPQLIKENDYIGLSELDDYLYRLLYNRNRDALLGAFGQILISNGRF